jgi:endonuclease/exonuclease/phosphatase family metal-dependent hydrolase
MTPSGSGEPASSRTVRRGRTRLLVLVAPLLAALFAPVKAADATSATLTFLQFNMCGNACGTQMAVVAELENSINSRSPQPFVVTLNEVCRSQYNKLWADLLPYYGHFEPTVPGRCWDGSDYGIAILLRTSNFSHLGSTPLPNPGGGEPRTMTCLQTHVSGASQPLVACVTHIDTGSANIAPQISAVASRAGGYWPGHKVLVGGDFNLTPESSALNPMYSTSYPGGTGVFNEADAAGFSRNGGGVSSSSNEYTGGCASRPCGWQAAYWNPTRKIDYVFLSRYDFVGHGADGADVLYSDHVPLWATATIT